MERGESGVQTWSGVEHAMWDADRTRLQQPVAQLLGGSRDRLRVYRTCRLPRQAGSVGRSVRDAGGVRRASEECRIHRNEDPRVAAEARWTMSRCRVIKKAVGPDFDDVRSDRGASGWVWDYPTALEGRRGLEREGAHWLEEPFDGHDLQGPARLAAEVDIPITGGELGHSVYEFLGFLTNKTYDIVQPDTRICGGIWIARKIGVLAESFGVPCIQHGTGGLRSQATFRPAAPCPIANFRK